MIFTAGDYTKFTSEILDQFNTTYYPGELSPEFCKFIEKKFTKIVSDLKKLGYAQNFPFPNLDHMQYALSRIGKVRFVIYIEAFLGLMPDVHWIDLTIPVFQELSKDKSTGDFLCISFVQQIVSSPDQKEAKAEQFIKYMENCHEKVSETLHNEVTYKVILNSITKNSEDFYRAGYSICLMLDKKNADITDRNKVSIFEFIKIIIQIYEDISFSYAHKTGGEENLLSEESFAEFMNFNSSHTTH